MARLVLTMIDTGLIPPPSNRLWECGLPTSTQVCVIDLLHIPDLILRLNALIPLFMQVISLTTGKMVHRLASAMERTKTLIIILS